MNIILVETLANLQHDVSQLAPKCKGKSCMEYCCDKETIGNASAHMLRENVIVPWRDDDVSHYNFGPLNSDVSIFIPELNVTLDRSFCVSHSCDRFKKEYTLFIPLSPTFPKTSLSLFFRYNFLFSLPIYNIIGSLREKLLIFAEEFRDSIRSNVRSSLVRRDT